MNTKRMKVIIHTVHKPPGTICFLNAPLADLTHQCLKDIEKLILFYFLLLQIYIYSTGGCDTDSCLPNKVTVFNICCQHSEIRQNSWAMSDLGMLWSKLCPIIFNVLFLLYMTYTSLMPSPAYETLLSWKHIRILSTISIFHVKNVNVPFRIQSKLINEPFAPRNSTIFMNIYSRFIPSISKCMYLILLLPHLYQIENVFHESQSFHLATNLVDYMDVNF